MIREVLEPHSGAILFKKDEESQLIDELKYRVEKLEAANRELTRQIEILTHIIIEERS